MEDREVESPICAPLSDKGGRSLGGVQTHFASRGAPGLKTEKGGKLRVGGVTNSVPEHGGQPPVLAWPIAEVLPSRHVRHG